MTLEILYKDDQLVAINKPHGLLVHPSPIARDADEFALQMLRDQLGQYVYPVHRLDRKTSGVLLFALSSEVAKLTHEQFMLHTITKEYMAIVRGHLAADVIVDYPLTNLEGKIQEAVTEINLIKQSEIAVPLGKFPTSRYSLVQAFPQTGRYHQIRKHLKHLFHPIIGDRPHGCSKQNRLFKQKWEMTTTLLHARALHMVHPTTKEELVITASYHPEFIRMVNVLKLV